MEMSKIYLFIIFNSLIEYLKKTIKKIPRYKKSNNYSYKEKKITSEFEILEKLIDEDKIHMQYLSRGYSKLDRYINVKPYQYNRIIINNKNHYINASPINIIKEKYFIATQGPTDETIGDFWTMIDEYNCNVIVMLCNLVENGVEKCAKYWSEANKMNNYIIKGENKSAQKYYIMRQFKLINISKKIERIIHHIQFIDWPDHDVPDIEGGTIFETFINLIKIVDSLKGDEPVVVHCSAGVGRTGTFISIYYLFKEIKRQIDENQKEIQFSIFNFVRKLKEMRILSVQTLFQYYFIHQFVHYILLKYNK